MLQWKQRLVALVVMLTLLIAALGGAAFSFFSGYLDW
jgi:hypothetical protein